MAHSSWRRQFLVVLVYSILALALTWPLVTRFTDHVPGNGVDDPPLTWNLWWVRHALLGLGIDPFDCAYLFYPIGINLAFYTLTILNGLLSIPWQAIWGLVPASNLLLLSSFVLSGYGAFLLGWYCLGRGKVQAPDEPLTPPSRFLAAFVAGLFYAFASCKIAYAALGQWNIASSQWIPFYVLYLFKMGECPGRRRYLLLAALFLWFQAYAELTYASFLVLFTAGWGMWRLFICLRERNVRQAKRLIGKLAVLGLLTVGGLIPVLVRMVPDMVQEGRFLVEGEGFADVFSADLLGFWVPTMYHPVLGSWVERFRFDYSVGQHIYVGYAVLALVLVAGVRCWRRPGVRFWFASACVFWVLTFGPSLRINGQSTGLPMPFVWIARLPFFEGNRYPSRYSVLLMLSLAMLVAFGLSELLRRRGGRFRLVPWTVSWLLMLLLLGEHLSVPLPLSDMRVPAVYDKIAGEYPGDWTLLDLPVAWRNGFRVTGTQHPVIMFEQYYQSAHGKRLLGGNTSRNPPFKFQYFTEAPVINTLIALETGHEVDPEVVKRDRSLAPAVLRFFNIEAVVVHTDQTGPDMIPYIEAAMPVRAIYEQAGIVAYRAELPPWPSTWDIQPGDALSRLSLGEGWGAPTDDLVWAQRRAVRLLVPLRGGRQRMTFRIYSPEGGSHLWVEANGQLVVRLALRSGWADYELEIPGDRVHAGLNEFRLRFDNLHPTEEIRLSPRSIGATGVESPVNLVVQSAGQEVGDLAYLYVNGRQVSLNQRGYNLVVVNAENGTVEQVASFDTHLNERASAELAAFLNQVPPGRIVAVAVADEASRLLGEEAVDALRRIGATEDLRGKFRWGQAIIGVQGAAPGAAVEAADWMRPVTLVVGEGATEPQLAAAFAWIRFTAVPE